MDRLKSFLGYTWAGLAIVIVLVTFMGSSRLSRVFASVTGISVSPWITGGEVAQTHEHGAYRTIVYRPVFDGLVGERSTGFVQIEWQSEGPMPRALEEKIDFEKERGLLFVVRLDTQTGSAEVDGLKGKILGVEHVYRLDKGWAVRITVKKPA